MDIKKLQRVIVEALEDVKGQDIRAFNSTGLTDLFDRVVIATGTSNRHTKALANSVRESVKAAGGDVLSMEGEEGGEWVLVDLGDAIVHIMQGPFRCAHSRQKSPSQARSRKERSCKTVSGKTPGRQTRCQVRQQGLAARADHRRRSAHAALGRRGL
jgi:ribosome-associated protein